MGIQSGGIIMSRFTELIIFACLFSSVVKADYTGGGHIWGRPYNPFRPRTCLDYRCPKGYFCDYRPTSGFGECEKVKSCTCKGNKLIVEGSSYVPTKEACQRKCQKQRSCKFFTYNVKSCTCGLRTFTPG